MDPTPTAIEVETARWEQWIAATVRAEHFRALTARPRTSRRRAELARTPPRIRRSLLWMLVVSLAGYWLLR